MTHPEMPSVFDQNTDFGNAVEEDWKAVAAAALAVAKIMTAAPELTLTYRAVSRGRRLHHPSPRRRQ